MYTGEKYKLMAGPASGLSGSTSFALSDLSFEIYPEKEKVKKDRPDVLTFILFFVSVCILLLTCFSLRFPAFLQAGFLLNLSGLANFSEPAWSAAPQKPVSSYLSHEAQRRAQKDVYNLLHTSRERLKGVRDELARLEREKESFYSDLVEKRRVFDEVHSVFGLGGSSENLKWENMKSLFYLFKRSVEFRAEYNRRAKRYEAIYEVRKGGFLEEEKTLLQRIDNLARSMEAFREIGRGRPQAAQASFFIDSAKEEYIERFFFFMEHDEYGKAVEILEKTLKLPFQDREKAAQTILLKMLVVLKEYRERVDFFRQHSPFEDIKLAYLNESYGTALSRLNRLEQKEYLKPMLSGLQGTLYSNIKQVQEIENEVEMKRKLKEIVKKAERFEQKGDYGGAIEIYESFFIYHISPYDREYLIKKLQSLRIAAEQDRIRREQNTRAIQYLSSAKAAVGKGDRMGALDYYRLLIKECPNSDYVGEAISGIVAAAYPPLP